MAYRILMSLMVVVVIGFLAVVSYDDKPATAVKRPTATTNDEPQKGLKINP